MELDAITPKLVEQALKALRYDDDPPDAVTNLDFLTVYRTPVERMYEFNRFVTDTVGQRLAHYRRLMNVPPVEDISTREQLQAALAADFAPQNVNLEAWSALYHRYIEADFMLDVHELEAASGQHERQFRRRVESGVRKLVRVLREAEQRAHQSNHAAYLRAGLNSPEYHLLYGVDGLRAQLVRQLTQAGGPLFVSLEGMGGIGKTALARAAAELLAEQAGLAGLIWISARSEKLTAGGIEPLDEAAQSLTDVVNQLWQKLGLGSVDSLSTDEKLLRLAPILANTRYLVVIDNLETVADSQLLIPRLHALAGATRFLITSRESLSAFGFVETYRVPELSPGDSAALLTAETGRLGQGAVALERADLDRIYDTVGGVPLALKLVAAQVVVMPVDRCLDGLRPSGRRPEALFEYIYRHTWRLLSDPARRLLFAIHDTITPDGARLRWLNQMGAGAGLSADEFAGALAELHRYSLLEISSAPDDRYYRLHRLTIMFLRNEFTHGA